MAQRPIFVPVHSGPSVVSEVMVEFRWYPGLAASQKRRNVCELHQAAIAKGLAKLLEISTKSDRLIGRRLSAFHLRIALATGSYALESVYHGSKVFESGGPYIDLFSSEPAHAKRDERLKDSGRLIAFELEGVRYPLSPATAFYDWLYARCLYPERSWLRRLASLDGFTDIEFNPARSINCQARSCATFVALEKRGTLDQALSSFSAFVDMQNTLA